MPGKEKKKKVSQRARNEEKEILFSLRKRNCIEKQKKKKNCMQTGNKYILLDVLLCSIAEYFYELCRILTSQNTNNE